MAIIRSGISFPSYAADAAWSTTAGMDADFPVTNLSDLRNIRSLAVAAAAGAVPLKFVFPAARIINFLAIVHHNIPAGTKFRVRLSAGTDPTVGTIYDSGLIDAVPGGQSSYFASLRPLDLGADLSVRSGLIEVSAFGSALEVGAIEVGQFWTWTDVNVPREIGIESGASVFSTTGGADHVTQQWSPRTIKGTRDVVDRSELDTKLLDFHRTTGMWKPFVWCWDLADPATWAREAVLVTNADLSPGTVNDFTAGSMAFSFKEHLL